MGSALFLLVFGLISACGSGGEQEDPVLPPFNFQYDLQEPEATFELDNDLEEISGLSLSGDGKFLIAIQDEDGTIFYLDKKTGEIEREVDFWKDGDYEGVEVVGQDTWVVKSSGTLYKVNGNGEEHLAVEKYNHFLGNRNDVEGLGFDPANNRLLLACKGAAGEGNEYRFQKAIYAFDLEKMQMDSTPVYLISLEDVQAYLGTSPAIRKLEKLIETFSLDKSEFVFSPSAIAVHPISGNYYILSSVGKLMMVLDPEKGVLHIEKLDKDLHPQPEGICFEADGTMYISNEGHGDDGTIHRFRFRGM